MSGHKGQVLFAAQQLCFAAETAAIHKLGESGGSIMQLALLRSAGGLVLVLVLAKGLPPWRTEVPWWQAGRCTASLGYLIIFFAVYRALPLADATAIAFLQPLFLVLYGAWFGEPVRRSQWFAIGLGFAAAMLVIRPTLTQVNWLYVLALFGAALNAAALATSRPIGRHDSALTILLYASATSAAATTLGACQQPLPPLSPWLLGIAFGPFGQLFGILAVRHAGVARLAAAGGFLRIPAALILGVALFGEFPDPAALTGAGLILVSAFLGTLLK